MTILFTLAVIVFAIIVSLMIQVIWITTANMNATIKYLEKLNKENYTADEHM